MHKQYRAPALRAMRAWIGMDQKSAAAGAGMSDRTLIDAEQGRACSDKSWTKLTGFYAASGLHLREGDGGELGKLLVITGD